MKSVLAIFAVLLFASSASAQQETCSGLYKMCMGVNSPGEQQDRCGQYRKACMQHGEWNDRRGRIPNVIRK